MWYLKLHWNCSRCQFSIPSIKYVALLPDLKQMVLWQPRGLDGVGGRRDVQEGGNVCMSMADSYWHVAETSIVKQLAFN